jgi:hypothetical protein
MLGLVVGPGRCAESEQPRSPRSSWAEVGRGGAHELIVKRDGSALARTTGRSSDTRTLKIEDVRAAASLVRSGDMDDALAAHGSDDVGP